MGFWKHKLVSFLMLIAAGLLLIMGLLLMGAEAVLPTTWFARMVAHAPALGHLGNFVYRNATIPIFVLVIGMIYFGVPHAKVRLRDVWVGALLAGLLWRLAYKAFAWYVGDLSRFSVHGSVAAVVVFLLWVYLSAVILLYGAEVSAAYARLRKHLPVDAPAAAPRGDAPPAQP
jgi:membrane protein